MTLKLPKGKWVRGIALVLLLLLLAGGALPQYWSGQWTMSTVPKVKGLKRLQGLTQNGLTIPGWETQQQEQVQLGGRQWSQQVLVQADSGTNSTEAIVWLRSQVGHGDRPQVEWTDLRGEYRWREDSVSTLPLPFESIEARWFRAVWETQQGQILTFAVLEWYAWPGGGHWSTNNWFWEDWKARWQGDRTPWIALALLVPMEPLGELEATRSQVMALAEDMNQALGKFWSGH